MSKNKETIADQVKQAMAEEIAEAIEKFVRAVDSENVPDAETLQLLAGRFSLWLEGEDTRKVFPKPWKGRRTSVREWNRRQRFATMVALCRQFGRNELDAIAAVAEYYNASENTVKKAYDSLRHEAKTWAAQLAKLGKSPP